jgi:hypothetical protein
VLFWLGEFYGPGSKRNAARHYTRLGGIVLLDIGRANIPFRSHRSTIHLRGAAAKHIVAWISVTVTLSGHRTLAAITTNDRLAAILRYARLSGEG